MSLKSLPPILALLKIYLPSITKNLKKPGVNLQGMTEYSYDLKIPKERIAVLIGKNGEIKREIESSTHSKLVIDSAEGDVSVTGTDPLTMFTTKDIIRAIGRGFNPEVALLLLKQDNVFEILDLKDYVQNKQQIPRIKGRIIGQEGKSRRVIEDLTETYICVYGKTVGIIGFGERVAIARRAVESLASGSQHSNVYKWLEKKRRELKESQF